MTTDYVHAGIFVPKFDANHEEDRFAFSPLGNLGMKLLYWDKSAYCSELLVSDVALGDGDPNQEIQASAAPDDFTLGPEKESKIRKRKADGKESSKLKKVIRGFRGIVMSAKFFAVYSCASSILE